MEFNKEELTNILKYLRIAKDQSVELFDAMIDIESYGEVDHDGMPVVNSRELAEDIKNMKSYITRIETNLSKLK